ncbi:MAG TPA: HAMP domain-containing sensor histidine kinase [Pseudonocardiaceae bacterium]|nr:HAMP domain-containing sensor histidine kinase [Pseudonocardiaceae bacterium]
MVRPRRGPGLRVRLTLLATGLSAAVSALLLWLGWLLVGGVVAAVPDLPPGSTVKVDGVPVAADRLGAALQEAARHRVLQAGSVAFLLAVLATVLLAWVITGQVLRPLHEVTATARRLSAESLDERLRLPGPRDEVAELADTFDAMLDRLQAAFESQRRFVANASHELRTPLAVVRTEVDVTLADPAADQAELRRMAAVIRDATLRAQQLVDGLLVLARTEGGALRAREPADLAGLAGAALRIVAGEARNRALRVTTRITPVLTVGDPALLERVVGNLVENAVLHNVAGGWLEICTDRVGSQARLRVRSSGEVIAPDAVAALFEPFHRGGVARTSRDGAGLGLSIVRAVVTAHAGTVHAEPVPGGGLAVTVHLPAA